MEVALLANLKHNAPTLSGLSPDQWAELDIWETIEAITVTLEKAGHHVTFLEGDKTLYNNLEAVKPEICFNICEGHFGDSREAQVPAILEMLRIPYTGSRILTLALTFDKPMTKRILAYHGLPTPPFQVFERLDELLDPSLQFPLMVKPSRDRAGIGVDAEAIVRDDNQLRAQLRHIFERYSQPALLEQFIEGREVMVGIVGNLATPAARQLPQDQRCDRVFEGLHLFPPLEVNLPAYSAHEAERYTNQTKVGVTHNFHCLCPAPLTDDQVAILNWLAAATFRILGCLDLARVDFRLDTNDKDKPYILEVNPLPGLNPQYSGLCLEAFADGWRYETLINRILDEAMKRHQLKPHLRPPSKPIRSLDYEPPSSLAMLASSPTL